MRDFDSLGKRHASVHTECIGCCLQLCCDVGIRVAFAFDDDAAVDGRNGLNHFVAGLGRGMLKGSRGLRAVGIAGRTALPDTTVCVTGGQCRASYPGTAAPIGGNIDFAKLGHRAPGGIRRVLHANAVCIRSLADSETINDAKHR